MRGKRPRFGTKGNAKRVDFVIGHLTERCLTIVPWEHSESRKWSLIIAVFNGYLNDLFVNNGAESSNSGFFHEIQIEWCGSFLLTGRWIVHLRAVAHAAALYSHSEDISAVSSAFHFSHWIRYELHKLASSSITFMPSGGEKYLLSHPANHLICLDVKLHLQIVRSSNLNSPRHSSEWKYRHAPTSLIAEAKMKLNISGACESALLLMFKTEPLFAQARNISDWYEIAIIACLPLY